MSTGTKLDGSKAVDISVVSILEGPGAIGHVKAKHQIDDTYFFEYVVVKVENTLFRVPKSGFNVPGTPFADLFVNPDTSSADNYLLDIKGVSKAHFKGFLRVLYPPNRALLTYDTLVGALELSSRWNFLELQKNIIQELDHSIQHMPLYAAISLARICNKGIWLLNALETIVLSKNAKDVVGLMRGGIDDGTIERIIDLRERFCAEQKRDTNTVQKAICQNFPEFDTMHREGPLLSLHLRRIPRGLV